MNSTGLTIVGLIFIFIAGFGWGQWYAERTVRKDRITLEKDRLVVSTPIDKDLAADVMDALSVLIRRAEDEAGKR